MPTLLGRLLVLWLCIDYVLVITDVLSDHSDVYLFRDTTEAYFFCSARILFCFVSFVCCAISCLWEDFAAWLHIHALPYCVRLLPEVGVILVGRRLCVRLPCSYLLCSSALLICS